MKKEKYVKICLRCGSTNITPYTKAGLSEGEILIEHYKDCGYANILPEVEESKIDQFRKEIKLKK